LADTHLAHPEWFGPYFPLTDYYRHGLKGSVVNGQYSRETPSGNSRMQVRHCRVETLPCALLGSNDASASARKTLLPCLWRSAFKYEGACAPRLKRRRVKAVQKRLPEQLQHEGRCLVCLRQDRDSGLLQDLRTHQLAHAGGNVGISDAAVGR